MLPKPLLIVNGEDDVFNNIGRGIIVIDGDANFSDTALLEGWPGDGSAENPFIIDGLEIDRGGEEGHCISIRNTQVSFIMRNCRLTGANITNPSFIVPPMLHSFLTLSGAGVLLLNVSNGELVNNTCNSNCRFGIYLMDSHLNTVVNNTCYSNGIGIFIWSSSSNTLVNNTCNSNRQGITLMNSHSNTVANNTCSSNEDSGIDLGGSHNIVANNTCNNNTYYGIQLYEATLNTVADNTCNNNTWGGIGLYMSGANIVVNNTCTNNGFGISFYESYSNTVVNNTCFHNRIGISIDGSDYNTMVNNTCNSNDIGISLEPIRVHIVDIDVTYWIESFSNTVANNTCNYNRIGIYVYGSESNTVVNNTFLGNTEHDIVDESELDELSHREFVATEFVWFLAGCGMILVVSVIAFVKFRRMEM